ncbi:MAG: DUF2924 domain-containing protein [Brevinema sp.]
MNSKKLDNIPVAIRRRYESWLEQAELKNYSLMRLEKQMQAGSMRKEVKFPDGSKLLRSYQGKTHQVIVQGRLFVYEGRVYKSLSAIANVITGKKWNGNLFFMRGMHR